MTSGWDPWNFRDAAMAVDPAQELTGFAVHATDGEIGTVDESSLEVDASHIVVDTGPWIFGKKVLLPAGIIERVDWEDESVYVDQTREQIKDSPLLGTGADVSDVYRDQVGAYWAGAYM